MTTLLGVLSQGSLSNPLTGVKRSVPGKPTSVPSQLPAFRGVANEPGRPIKAPKLSPGNRPDRGTNVTVPYARLTALTSLHIKSGRLSPGDVCFIRRTPAGFSGSQRHNHMGTASHMTDMFGMDGVNRMLSGTLNGMRSWQIGYNLVNTAANKNPINHATDVMDKDFVLTPGTQDHALKVLFEHRLDGVIMSNEEPHSFAPTGEHDAALFNIAIRGHAATNNGFLDYDQNSAVELYARAYDPLAYVETLRIGAERAGDTWNGKIGYDFVAAYTGTYSEYPLQMFDRKAQSLDHAYLILRRYNLQDDVVAPRASVTGESEVDVVKKLKLLENDGSQIPFAGNLDSQAGRRKYVFFQYMPCTSRAFAQYNEMLKKIDASLEGKAPPKLSPQDRVDLMMGTATNDKVDNVNKERLVEYRSMLAAGKIKLDRMDAVRFEDIFHSAGAWHVGRIVDTRAANTPGYSGGPVNTSYRMTVSVDVRWMTRNKPIIVDSSLPVGAEDYERRESTEKSISSAIVYPQKSLFAVKDKADPASNTRRMMGYASARTLAGRELGEKPIMFDGDFNTILGGGAAAVNAVEAAFDAYVNGSKNAFDTLPGALTPGVQNIYNRLDTVVIQNVLGTAAAAAKNGRAVLLDSDPNTATVDASTPEAIEYADIITDDTVRFLRSIDAKLSTTPGIDTNTAAVAARINAMVNRITAAANATDVWIRAAVAVDPNTAARKATAQAIDYRTVFQTVLAAIDTEFAALTSGTPTATPLEKALEALRLPATQAAVAPDAAFATAITNLTNVLGSIPAALYANAPDGSSSPKSNLNAILEPLPNYIKDALEVVQARTTAIAGGGASAELNTAWANYLNVFRGVGNAADAFKKGNPVAKRTTKDLLATARRTYTAAKDAGEAGLTNDDPFKVASMAGDDDSTPISDMLATGAPAGVSSVPLVPQQVPAARTRAPPTGVAPPASRVTTRAPTMVDAAIEASKTRSKSTTNPTAASAATASSATASSASKRPKPSAATSSAALTPTPVPPPSAAAATAAAVKPGGVVESVFDSIFGTSSSTAAPSSLPTEQRQGSSARTAAAAQASSRTGAVSPTPSSGSDTGPMTFTRRNR